MWAWVKKMLNICFLGKLKFEYEDHDITEKVGIKTAALVAVLMLQQNRDISREKVIAYLWPDSNEEAAKYNLRYNLWLLKKIIPPDLNEEQFLRINKEYCGINFKYNFRCDILNAINFDSNKSYTIEELLELKITFAGDFFEGHYFNNCDEFNEMIIFERNNFENRKIKVFRKLAELYEEEENYDACLEVINEILNIEPYDENLALKVMSLYICCENRGGAIKFYKSFCNKLICSLGIHPSELLQNKYNEIKSNSTLETEKLDSEKTRVYSNITGDMKTIKINTSGIKAIEYFWIADTIDEIIKNGFFEEDTLSKNEIADLAYIMPYIGSYSNIDYDRSVVVPPVRIIKAFIKLIQNICSKYILYIKIQQVDNMDNISLEVLEQLKRSNIENLFIEF